MQLLVQVDDVVFEVGHLVGLGLDDSELALEVGNRVVENLDIQETLVVLGFALRHVGLQNLDFLVEEGQLVIPADELCSEHVPLVYDLSDFLLLDLVVVVEFADDERVPG